MADTADGDQPKEVELFVTGFSKACKLLRVQELLTEGGVDFVRVERSKGTRFAFVAFKDAKTAEENKEKIECIKGGKGFLRVGETRKRKRKAEDDPENERIAKARREVRTARAVTCSLADLTYEEQLAKKHARVLETVEKLKRLVRVHYRRQEKQFPAWMGDGGIEIEKVVPSPQIEGYRNKCEFTIGRDVDGNVVVGFNVGGTRDGLRFIGEPYECPNVSDNMKGIVRVVTAVLRKSTFPPFSGYTSSGFWRICLVRESVRTRDCVVMFVVSEKEMAVGGAEELRRVSDQIWELCKEENVFVTGITYQVTKLLSVALDRDNAVIPLRGESQVREELGGLSFHVAPEAFFQVNTSGAEVLFRRAGEYAGVTSSASIFRHQSASQMQSTGSDGQRSGKEKESGEAARERRTVVLDICCGTGTVGQLLADPSDPNVTIVGIDVCAEAIENARENAKRNGFSSCEYVAEKAEVALPDLLERYVRPDTNIVAIVDPPRAGLHKNVRKALLNNTRIQRLVYVSCNPNSLCDDASFLCNGSDRSDAFVPIKAVGVDMFPQTPNVEMVMLLERSKDRDTSDE